MNITELDKALKAVCPIDGVSIGAVADKSTWRISFKDEATTQQRAAAQAVVDVFDTGPSAEEQRYAAIDAAIGSDTIGGKTIPELKAMSKDELAAWWTPIAPPTLAGVNVVLFKIIRLLIRRVF